MLVIGFGIVFVILTTAILLVLFTLIERNDQ